MKKSKPIYFTMSVLIMLCFRLIFISSAYAIDNGGYANEKLLVGTTWLEQHLNDPNLRILDRQDIEPQDNFYAAGHIPNSIMMPTSAIKGLKDEIPEMLILSDLVKFLESNGVSADHHIVLIGRSDRLPATSRVFWALEILGHKNISILDGGIEKWKAEKRSVTTTVPNFGKSEYKVASLHREHLMTGEELHGYLGLFERLNLMVIDSRRPDEFKGMAASRSSNKVGHIPGATNLMFMEVLTGKEYKEFKSAEDIKKIFQSKGMIPDKHLSFTCVSGCFGTTLYFGARLLGYQNVSVYDGAWIEWSRRNYPTEPASASGGAAPVQKAPASTEKMIIKSDEGC